MNRKKNHKYFLDILQKYFYEIKEFSYELAKKFHEDNQIYKRGAFSDTEGIFLYCLIREVKPNLIFEISPDTGMSTNYIIQAVARNGFGKVIGFELEEYKHKNIPTLEVIRSSQTDISSFDKFYQLEIGDATITCDLKKFGTPDIVLIDSCHDDWFADWYLKYLIPNVKKYSLIQDISYYHKIEGSTEAHAVLKNFKNSKKNFLLIDKFREFFLLKDNYFPIRNYLTNSILIAGNEEEIESIDNIYENYKYSDLANMNPPDINKVSFLIHNAFPGGISQFAPRYLAYCLCFEKNKHIYSWLRDSFIGSLYISRTREKELSFALALINRNQKNRVKSLKLILKVVYIFPFDFLKVILKLIIRKIKN